MSPEIRNRDGWLFGAALRLVPRTWRDSVRQDLGEEWRGGWAAVDAAAIGIGLRWTFGGAALLSDVRYGLRAMVRARGFALGAIVTFALGIGVNVAVFSAVDRMLFRPLPYARPGGMAVLGEYPVGGTLAYGTVPATYVVDARRLPAVADAAIATWNPDSYRLTENPDGAQYLSFVETSYNMLAALGVRPVIGDDFTEDDARTKQHKVLISDGVWHQAFGGRADVIGRSVWSATAGETATIVGVLPADFIPPQIVRPNLSWSGLSVTDDTFDEAAPTDRFTPPIVRLTPGASLSEAQAQIDTLVAGLRPPGTASRTAQTVVRLVPLRDALFGSYRLYLGLVFAAATLVLLVACANLASLLLVRARSRESLTAVQIALGASSGRVLQAAVVEALLLATTGCALALAVLGASARIIAAWLPPLFSTYAAPVFATRVLVFSAGLATASAIAAGVLPGLRSARVDVLAILQRGATRVGAGRLRGSGPMLAAEVAVSLVLVTCAALTGRSLVGLLRTDVGFTMDRLEQVNVVLPVSKDAAALRARYGGVLDVLRATPGVEAAAGADVLPIIGASAAQPMWQGDRQGMRWAVTDGFVETMGMRVLAGRPMSAADVQSSAPVGLLSESGVTLVWPGVAPREAVGRFLQFPGEPPREVIGVVSDVRGSYDQHPWPSLYVPLGSAGFRIMMYVARLAPGRSLNVIDFTHRLEQYGDSSTRAVSAMPVVDRFNQHILDQKFRAELFSSFGAVGLFLAFVGLYAVQAFVVGLRETEMGIRLSLGATPQDLWHLLIRQTLRPVLAGIVIGSVATFWAAQFLQSFLAQVNARDPWTYASVAAGLLAVSVAAAWLPTRRAARVDPAVTLRAQ